MPRGRAEDGDRTIRLDRELAPPFFAHNYLTISGCIGSPQELETVVLRHDGVELPATLAEGRFGLTVDTSAWPRGEHELLLEARWRDGTTASTGGLVEVQPYAPPPPDEAAILAEVAAGGAAMWCEQPGFAGGDLPPGEVEIRGWAIAPAGLSRVLVTVDSSLRAVALHGLPRPDLRDGFGDDLAADCGFALRLAAEELPPGRHEIAVVALAADGSAQGMGGIVTVASPEPEPAAGSDPIEPLPPRLLSTPPAGDRPADLFEAPLRETLRRPGAYALIAALGIEGRALDLGCEGGAGTALLARTAEATGFDVSPLRIADAQGRWGDRASFSSGEMTALPFTERSFDLVVGIGVLGRVAEPAALLEEMCRVLAPGGILAVGLDPPPAGAPFRRAAVEPEWVRGLLAARFERVEALEPRLWLSVGGGEGGFAATPGTGPGEAIGGPRLFLAGPASLAAPTTAAAVDVDAVEDEQRQLTELWRERSVAAEVKMATLRTDVHYLNTAHRLGLERAAARVEAAEAEAAALAAANEALRRSASWRLTRPLRGLRRALRRS